MKRTLALFIIAAVPFLVSAQTKPAPDLTDLELATFARDYTLGTPFRSYDTLAGDRVVYSGIVVQIFRAPRPLQLLNPWAPKAYEPTQPVVVVDPITRRPVGLRFFTVSF
jgi:hypothetical protein